MACGLWIVATDMDTAEENGGSAESVAAENNELEGRDGESFVAVDLEVGIEGVQVGMLGTGAAPTSLQQKEVVAGLATLMREGLFEEGSNWRPTLLLASFKLAALLI